MTIEKLQEKLRGRLEEVRKETVLDEWEEGVQFGREDMLDEIIELLNN